MLLTLHGLDHKSFLKKKKKKKNLLTRRATGGDPALYLASALGLSLGLRRRGHCCRRGRAWPAMVCRRRAPAARDLLRRGFRSAWGTEPLFVRTIALGCCRGALYLLFVGLHAAPHRTRAGLSESR